MNQDSFDRINAMALINRARLDVLERAVAIFMATAHRQTAEAIEDQFRRYIELGVTSLDSTEAQKMHLADEAAVRFADVLAQALARPR